MYKLWDFFHKYSFLVFINLLMSSNISQHSDTEGINSDNIWAANVGIVVQLSGTVEGSAS